MTSALSTIEELFRCLAVRDKAGAMACFANDAVLYDPHYPVPEMKGMDAISSGIDWGLESMEQFGFTIEHSFSSEDGSSAAVEVDTHHKLKGGRDLRFPQAFFVDAVDGKITRLRAYEPYGPNGAMGFFLRLSHIPARRKMR